MVWTTIFHDAPEYEERRRTPFKPPDLTISELHTAVPRYLFERSSAKAMGYVLRDIGLAVVAYKLASLIDPSCNSDQQARSTRIIFLKYALWGIYWYFQSLIFAGWWIIGHDAGHGNLSPNPLVNHIIGFGMHTFLMVPYYSWRATHNLDTNYVPRTRADFDLPPESIAKPIDYREVFEDTPLYNLWGTIVMQVFGLPAYLLFDAKGNPSFPVFTNHFNPNSPLFRPDQRLSIVASDIGLAMMSILLCYYVKEAGFASFLKLYLIPYMGTNHWVVMITFLQHSDPTIPHYRNKEWTFLRGALATVDRPLLGWCGRFFLHNASHDHIAHHIFSTIPFYNLPMVTAHLKPILKEHRNYDSTNCFRALYRNLSETCFIETEGDIIFFKNQHGIARREIASKEIDTSLIPEATLSLHLQ